MIKLTEIPFYKSMRHCQKTGVRLIERTGGRCIVADPTGSGKTILTLAYLALYPELRPALIVVNSTAKLKWADEINKWMPWENVQIISGKKESTITGDIILINWDIIHYSEKSVNPKYKTGQSKKKHVTKFFARKELKSTKWKCIVGDEIHKIANRGTGRTTAFQQLARNIKKVITLSATPIEHKPIDFFNLLKILDNAQFGNWWNFTKQYCGRKHDGFGWNVNGSSNLKELHGKIKPFLIRREVAEILPELPPENRVVIPLEISNRQEYTYAKNNYTQWLRANNKDVKKAKRALHLTQIEVLKNLAVKGTVKQVIQWLDDFLESGEKIVVGCIHREINDQIYAHFKKQAVQIIGGMTEKKKHKANLDFLNDPKIKIASCNLIAAGESIDLQSASATCTIEIGWKPAIHTQFEGRIGRIGQLSKILTHFYLVGHNTIMEKIAELVNNKKRVVDSVIEGSQEEMDFISDVLKTL